MSSHKICSVRGCPSSKGKPKEILYMFPLSNTQRYKRWLSLYPNSFDLIPDRRFSYICRRHFTEECFDTKTRLKHIADPTKNIDTSYAQDQILRAFLVKVMYEWSIRNAVNDNDIIVQKTMEAKDMLGIRNFKADRTWITKFELTLQNNVENGIHFGTDTGSTELFDIIKDIRGCLPSNFTLPVDLQPAVVVKKEPSPEADTTMELTEAVALPQTLDTYQDALDAIKPLGAYIARIGNMNALCLLREVETVIKHVIKFDQPTARALKKSR